MNSYLNTYFSRVNHRGKTVAEIAQNTGIRSFEKWLSESPNTVEDLSVERGIYFNGIILTNKDKEHKKIMFLNVAVDIPLEIGDILNWESEKWIIFQKERRVRETHQIFYIIRCNYYIKWVDELGHLQGSWCHFSSSLDSKVKENFRTWSALITPQPNKYAEVILPRQIIERGTRFIVEDEGWYVIEYDHSSVPGIMYLSLSEEKVNLLADDLVQDIADTDKLARYEIISSDEVQTFSIGDEILPIYNITKNGIPTNLEVVIESPDKRIAKYVDDRLIAVGDGTTTLTIKLKDFPTITMEQQITVGTPIQFHAYINGADNLKLNRSTQYELVTNEEINESVLWSLDSEYAEIISDDDNICVIKANAKNKLGSFKLICEYKGVIYEKMVQVVPLW